jgi:lipopolysaccharide export system permease protein
VGRSANLGFAFLIFVVYFNFLVLGKSWVESGQVQFAPFLLVLHGGALALAALWLTKRHTNWTLRLRARPTGNGNGANGRNSVTSRTRRASRGETA